MNPLEGRIELMDVSSAEAFVIELLRERGPLSTMQIEKLARSEHKHCPDQTVIFLTKMKKKGLIKGEASLERRGWVWWVP
jgi:predicted transcriptional regulator